MKQTAYFKFGSVDQSHSGKHIQVGELMTAQNVRQTSKKGVYAKRLPFKRTVPTFSGASFGTAKDLLPGVNGGLLAVDSSDQAWAYGTSNTTFGYRGKISRAFATWRQSQPVSLSSVETKCAVAGTQIWQFSYTPGGTAYYYTVSDVTTGATLVAKTTVSDTAVTEMAMSYDGSKLWVFYANASAVKCHKYNPASPTTAAVITTYYTPTTVTSISVSAYYLTSTAKTAVCIGWRKNTATQTRNVYRSYLDTTTGQPSSSPAAVLNTMNSVQDFTPTVRILEQPGATSTWYFVAAWTVGGAAGADFSLSLWKVTASDLTASIVELESNVATKFSLDRVGHYDGTNVNVYHQQSGVSLACYNVIDRYVYNGSTTTKTAAFMRGATVASFPFYLNSEWQIITGFNDTGGDASGVQQAVHLRGIDGAVRTQIAYGETAAWKSCRVPVYSTTKALYPIIMQSAITGQQSPGLVTVYPPSGYTLGPSAQIAGRAFVAGGVPSVFTASDTVHELSPMQSPHSFSDAGGSGAGPASIAALYSYQDTDGTLYRSAPIVHTDTILLGATATVSTLRVGPNAANARIEFYAATSGGQLQYQASIANDPTVDTLTWTVTNNTGGETIYTAGGGLSAAPLPPCQAVGSWRNRTFLASGNVLWYSQEITPGTAPLFNEVLRATWAECDGDITAICPIDYNYCAVFSGSKIAVISGPGPDGRGQGNYTIQTLPTTLGCSNARSVVSGPQGAYFAEATTGRLYVITAALQVVECAPGARDIIGASSIFSSTWHPAEKMLVFPYSTTVDNHAGGTTTTTGLVVLDSDNPTQAAPFGQVYNWTTASVATPGGICVDSTGLVWMNSNGNLMRQAVESTARYDSSGNIDGYTDDNNSGTKTAIQMLIKTGRLQPIALGEFSVSRVFFHGSWRPTWASGTLGTNALTIAAWISVKDDIGGGQAVATTTTANPSVDGNPFELSARPSGLMRTSGVYVTIYDDTNTTQTAPNFDFEMLALEFTPRGRAKHLNSGSIY